jgi:O-antigen/teichoic acid export membrane protein
MPSELKRKAVKSVAWVTVGQAASQLLSLVVTGVLARLLAPEFFGLIGMVAVLLAVLETFQELGLSTAVIQRQDVTEEQLKDILDPIKLTEPDEQTFGSK